MHCVRCGRPLTTPAKTIASKNGPLMWGPVCAIKSGLIEPKARQRTIITPEGLALRARLTVDYIQTSFQLYRLVRQRMIAALDEVEQAGLNQVRLAGEGDVAEVCRLTCLERGVMLTNSPQAPLLNIQGMKIYIDWDGTRPNHPENTVGE